MKRGIALPRLSWQMVDRVTIAATIALSRPTVSLGYMRAATIQNTSPSPELMMEFTMRL
jgi:hypothetical protein